MFNVARFDGMSFRHYLQGQKIQPQGGSVKENDFVIL